MDNRNNEVKWFSGTSEAIEYARNLAKYEHQKAMIGDENVILCSVCLPYEDEFYPFAEKILDKFGISGDIDPAELRDAFIKAFEEMCDTKFVTGFDTF